MVPIKVQNLASALGTEGKKKEKKKRWSPFELGTILGR